MRKMVVLAGLCALLCGAGCAHRSQQKEESGTYTATAPLRVDTSFVKEYVSQIRSVRNIEIRAQEKGFLQDIYVDEGQFVRAGQLLFRIMPKLYEAELQKAEAEARAAAIEVQNSRLLSDKGVVSPNELAMAQAKLQKARAEVTLARVHLSFTEIRAPFDGSIDRIPRKLGSLIDEGELLTSLSDNSRMLAYFNVSEPEYLDYKASAGSGLHREVGLLLANNKPLPARGVVETIESEFDAETGN
ncbi:MAG: efflux RND transporter periplasmic adaptor subunit, partial [Chitinophagaceae bacterium]